MRLIPLCIATSLKTNENFVHMINTLGSCALSLDFPSRNFYESYAPFPISCIVTSLNNSKVLDRLQRNFVHIINTLAVVHLRLIFNPISFMRAMPLFQFPVFFLSGQLSNAEWISMKLGKQVMISLLGNGALALDFSIWPF